MEYKEYLKSDHWKYIKDRWYISKKHRYCSFCKSDKYLVVHHRRYWWKGISVLYNEVSKNLSTLCKSCHNLWHLKHKNKVTLWGDIKRIQKSIRLNVPVDLAIEFCSKSQIKEIRKRFKKVTYRHVPTPTG